MDGFSQLIAEATEDFAAGVEGFKNKERYETAQGRVGKRAADWKQGWMMANHVRNRNFEEYTGLQGLVDIPTRAEVKKVIDRARIKALEELFPEFPVTYVRHLFYPWLKGKKR